MHFVFSTKRRQKMIDEEIRELLWEFIGGIARQNKAKMLAIGGIEDHVHLLMSLPSTMAVARAMNLIKGASSKWVHDNFPEHQDFQWQDGYGAFSVSLSNITSVTAYINNQVQHHKIKTFEQEFLAILNKHSIEYDEQYVLG
ncbi:MAG: transposase IS200-family protein [bacterium]|nr:MAG: transposase IS200-family protein [bacterium]